MEALCQCKLKCNKFTHQDKFLHLDIRKTDVMLLCSEFKIHAPIFIKGKGWNIFIGRCFWAWLIIGLDSPWSRLFLGPHLQYTFYCLEKCSDWKTCSWVDHIILLQKWIHPALRVKTILLRLFIWTLILANVAIQFVALVSRYSIVYLGVIKSRQGN